MDRPKPYPIPTPLPIRRPDKPSRGQCTCNARADYDDNLDREPPPEKQRQAYCIKTANDCSVAATEAKRCATQRLGEMNSVPPGDSFKPKHVQAVCVDSNGNVKFYK